MSCAVTSCQTNAGEDINFSWEECKSKVRGLTVLWNTHKLLINLSRETNIQPFSLKEAKVKKYFAVEEKYMLSRFHSVIRQVTELMGQHRMDEVIAPLEELFLELSRAYIQMVREKSLLGEEEEKEACLYTFCGGAAGNDEMYNIIAPFICEAMYQNLKKNSLWEKKASAITAGRKQMPK